MTDAGFQLSFQSSYFQPVDGEENETNPGCLGKALALWLADQLRQRGVGIREVGPEDWGWIVELACAPARLWFGCGNTTGTTDQWQIFLAMERSLLARMMGRPVPHEQLAALKAHLTEIARHIPLASNVAFD